MLKSLFATCLTALSVNTQPLAVPPSLEPSRAISEGNILPNTTYNFKLEKGIEYDDDIFTPFDTTNSNFLLLSFYANFPYTIENNGSFVYNDTTFNDVYIYFYDDDSCTINFSFDINSTLIFRSSDILNTFDFDYYFEFTFRTTNSVFGSFYDYVYPYISIVDNPYTPPAKSNLYRLLYDFYYSIFNDDDLTAITTGYNMPFDNWLAHTCTIATLITLIVVAFFFLRWLFRVISGLVLLKR